MPYLSPRALDGFNHYQYKPAGYTYLDVLHTPFWNWFTNLLPIWLAPNLITLAGLLCVIAAFALDAWFTMDYQGAVPDWVYVFRAVAVIVYVNLDCIDGKQARRTRSSSPLGQLFDHGCDALSVRLLLDSCHATLDYPCGWTAAIIIMLVMLPWILAHWEEYHTGNLLYGNGWFGVLECNYLLAFVHFTAFFFGGGVWSKTLNSISPVALPVRIEVRDLYFAAFVAGALSQVVHQLHRVFIYNDADLPQQERGNKELGMAARVKHLVYILLMLLLGMWWTSDSEGAYGECRAASVTYGLVYALVASDLIVAHMAKEPMAVPFWAYVLLTLGSLNRQLRLVDTWTSAMVLMLVALAGYLHYVVGVVNEICDALGIRVFVIKVHKQE